MEEHKEEEEESSEEELHIGVAFQDSRCGNARLEELIYANEFFFGTAIYDPTGSLTRNNNALLEERIQQMALPVIIPRDVLQLICDYVHYHYSRNDTMDDGDDV